MNNKFNTVKLAKLAMMVAISCVLVLLIRIPYPPAPFLVYDPADIPIYITTFAFGPIAGLTVTLIVSLIQAFVLGGDGVYGFIMHFFATGIFALIAGGLYRHKKSKKGSDYRIGGGRDCHHRSDVFSELYRYSLVLRYAEKSGPSHADPYCHTV